MRDMQTWLMGCFNMFKLWFPKNIKNWGFLQAWITLVLGRNVFAYIRNKRDNTIKWSELLYSPCVIVE